MRNRAQPERIHRSHNEQSVRKSFAQAMVTNARPDLVELHVDSHTTCLCVHESEEFLYDVLLNVPEGGALVLGLGVDALVAAQLAG